MKTITKCLADAQFEAILTVERKMQLSAAAAVSVHINQMRSAVQSQFKRHFSLLPLLSCRSFKKNIYMYVFVHIYGEGARGMGRLGLRVWQFYYQGAWLLFPVAAVAVAKALKGATSCCCCSCCYSCCRSSFLLLLSCCCCVLLVGCAIS